MSLICAVFRVGTELEMFYVENIGCAQMVRVGLFLIWTCM